MGKWPGDFIQAFSAHNIDDVLSHFADDVFYEEVVADGVVAHGKQELRARIQGIFAAWPDIQLQLTSHFSCGEHHCVEWISSGTLANARSDVHLRDTADSPGSPATVKRISYREVVVAELKGGKISRFSLYCDMMTLMRQLGVQPQTMASDPFIGTWKLNITQSQTSDLRTMPKSEILKTEGLENGLKSTFDFVSPDGRKHHTVWSVKYDGKDYPTIGDLLAETVSITKIDANTLVFVNKMAGKEVARWRGTVSKDGEMQTWTGNAKKPNGQEFNATWVYDKQ